MQFHFEKSFYVMILGCCGGSCLLSKFFVVVVSKCLTSSVKIIIVR